MNEDAAALGVNQDAFAEACGLIKTEEISCVVISGGEIVRTAGGRGVGPLMMLYQNEKETLRDSCVVDRVIGKAAAMLLVLGKTKAVYGEVMSVSAMAYLDDHGVLYRSGKCVDMIYAQSGTDMCPMEAAVLHIDSPEDGLAALTVRIAELQSMAGK